MTAYVIRRLLQTVLVLFGVTALSFGTMFLSGDPTMAMAGENWTASRSSSSVTRWASTAPGTSSTPTS